MATIKASWRQIANEDSIRRSSQIVAAGEQEVIVFGGEIKPRQPVDNKLYRIPLSASRPDIKIAESTSAPSPRVGSASTTLKGKTYLFSGRGGEAMAPIEENGVVHVLDTASGEWSTLSLRNASESHPEARSYHAMTSDNNGTIYVHAGCPEKGRLSDLWAFDIKACTWRQLADAPGPARGGTSIAFFNGKLYRMNGFDGKHEQGFALDIYDVASNNWSTKTWDTGAGPSPRSVSTLLTIQVPGRDILVTMFGECDPSTLGHQGAGKMLDDVWAYDVADETWMRVVIEGDRPQSRGWFAADALREKNEIVVHGGLAKDNSRIGDVWTLAF